MGFTYLTYDLRTLEALAELPLRGVQATKKLKQIADLTGFVPLGDPLWQYVTLPDDVRGLTFTGLSSEVVSSVDPSNPAADVNVRVGCTPTDWTPAFPQVLASQYEDVTAGRGWMFGIYPDGKLFFAWAPTGGTLLKTEFSTVATGATDGVKGYVGVDFDADNGASAYTVKFYTSSDGQTYTQLGTTVTGGAASSIAAGTADANVGGLDGDGSVARQPTFVDKSAQVDGTSATLTPTVPAAVAAGDLVIAHITGKDATAVFTEPASEGWSSVVGPIDSGTVTDQIFAKVWGVVGNTDDTTPTFTSSVPTNGWGVTVSVIRNPANTRSPWTTVASAVDVSASSSPTASGTMTAPTATSTGVNRLVLRFYGSADDNAHASPSAGTLAYGGASYDSVTGSDYAQSMAYESGSGQGAVGTATMTQSVNGNDRYNAVTIVIKATEVPTFIGQIDHVDVRYGLGSSVQWSWDPLNYPPTLALADTTWDDYQGNTWTRSVAALVGTAGGTYAVDKKNIDAGSLPTRTLLVVDYNGTIVWSGIIWARMYESNSRQWKFTASTLDSFWARQNIDQTLTYVGTEQATIVRDIIDLIQAIDGGDVNVFTDSVVTGRTRDRVYKADELKNALEAIQQLSDVIDGFDYAFDTAWDTNHEPKTTLNIGYPRRGRSWTQTDTIFDYPGSILYYDWPEDGHSMSTKTHAKGAGEGDEGLRLAIVNQNLINAGYPLLQQVYSYQDIIEVTTLEKHARADLAAFSEPLTTPKVVVKVDGAVPLGTYIEGDDVVLSITDDRFPNGISAAFRLLGYTFNPTDMTVELDIGTLTALSEVMSS